MSLLAEALNRIRAWLETNYPKVTQNLPPGLHISEIQKMVETLSFELPNEVYELYQWSCGTDEKNRYDTEFIFGPDDSFTLCSLQQAANIASTFEDELDELAINYLGQPLFPLFQSEELSYLCVIGTTNKQESSPVILADVDMDIRLQYTSLTTMMLTLAECFETGVLYENESLFDNLYNEEKFPPIYRKYNYEVPELSITNFCQYLLSVQSDTNKLCDTLDAFIYQVAYLKKYWRNLSLNQFSSKLTEPVLIATQHENQSVRSRATVLINAFNEGLGI
jgi:hypothetical protein